METRLYPCRPQLGKSPLTFKNINTNIVLFFVVVQALRAFKTSTILVHMIFNGEGDQTGVVYMGSHVSILFK